MPWRDRFYDFLTRRIASARFRSKAARAAFLRPVARAQAAQLFDLVAGFVYTQTLLAFVRLDVARLVNARPRTPGELSRLLVMPIAGVEVLLRSACALGLLRARHDGTYGLGVQGATLVENPGLCAMIEHNAVVYADLADPVAFLRKERPDGALAAFWAYGGAHGDAAPSAAASQAYSQLMATSQDMIADDVLAAVSLGTHRRLLDVGGGHGAFALAVASRWPHLEICVFDLPAVADAAALAARARGLANVTARGGDFLRDALPAGADVISLLRVLHDHEDAAVLRLLSAACDALDVGGTLLIAEPMRGSGAQARMADAYFGFYLRGMGRGRVRSADEIETLMRRAGFTDVQRKATKVPLVVSVLVGKRAQKRQIKLTS